jgi:acetyltransferase-like isoleucine patch superfamily enzyme
LKTVNIFVANVLATLIQLTTYAAAYVAGIYLLFQSYETWGITVAVLLLPVFVFIMAFLVILETFFLRLIIPKPRPGAYKLGEGGHFLFQLNKKVFSLAINPAFPPLAILFKMSDFFRILILKSQGANIRFSSKIARTARIHDPYLVTVGREAVIGEEVQIFGSAQESGRILLYRVFIGPKAHVSASALLFPGTEIGEGSVLGMGSSTRNEMKIPAYELWVGNPASHLSKLSRPMLYTASPVTPTQEREPRRFQERFSGGGRPFRGRGNDRGERDRGDRGDRGRDRGRGDRDNRRRGRDDRQNRYGAPRPFQKGPASAPGQTESPAPAPAPPPEPQVREEVLQAPPPQQAPPQAPRPVAEPVKARPDTYIGPIDITGKPAAPQPSSEPSKPSENTSQSA